jgi:predicted nucleic acid-binding protein
MIVFDASTLILIAKAGLLDTFLDSSGMPVIIPCQVEKECYGSKKALDALIIQRAVTESRISVLSVSDSRQVAKVAADFTLGKGEAEAIVLALNKNAALLGIDDKNGINACRLLGIAFTTAISILIRTREKALIDGAQALEKLALLARHGRYKISLIEDARRRLETIA